MFLKSVFKTVFSVIAVTVWEPSEIRCKRTLGICDAAGAETHSRRTVVYSESQWKHPISGKQYEMAAANFYPTRNFEVKEDKVLIGFRKDPTHFTVLGVVTLQQGSPPKYEWDETEIKRVLESLSVETKTGCRSARKRAREALKRGLPQPPPSSQRQLEDGDLHPIPRRMVFDENQTDQDASLDSCQFSPSAVCSVSVYASGGSNGSRTELSSCFRVQDDILSASETECKPDEEESSGSDNVDNPPCPLPICIFPEACASEEQLVFCQYCAVGLQKPSVSPSLDLTPDLSSW